MSNQSYTKARWGTGGAVTVRPSVCLSVCQCHKPVPCEDRCSSRGFHHQAAQAVFLVYPLSYATVGLRGTSLRWLQTRLWWVITTKERNCRPIINRLRVHTYLGNYRW